MSRTKPTAPRRVREERTHVIDHVAVHGVDDDLFPRSVMPNCGTALRVSIPLPARGLRASRETP
jgi:hypothetical protein